MIIINGTSYSGNNITITNGVVRIDGVTQGEKVSGVVEILITEGAIANLNTDASVNCNNVGGDVQAGGSVNCENVSGSVHCGGSVKCNSISGNVVAGGSVRHG